MEIYKNEYFSLFSDDNKLFISVYHSGYKMREFNNLLLDMPALQPNNFTSLKNALDKASGLRICIGNIKPRVEVILSSDEMEARIKLNITAKEFAENKISISSEIIETLNSEGIVFGLDKLFKNPITVQKEITVAKGKKPQNGEDAIIKYYEIQEKKPIVKEDGTVNHYELNLIDNVKKGDLLGEKMHPTEGKPGKTVTGKILPPRRGIDFTLKYDRKTVEEHKEDNKTILRAAIDGAVKFEGDIIRVDSHLIIPGDVGYETGNITFDGYVTVKGTVKDGFSVIAKNDISIQSNMGLGVINKIISKEGSIYIKGGIFGKNVSIIEAGKSVFVKYCNECKITAGDDINIGFYALDSDLKAKKIIMDPIHGKIIGGSINAEIQVITGVLGNRSEKKTYVYVSGFDREAIKNELNQLLEKYKNTLTEVKNAKQQIESFELNISGAEYVNSREYNQYLKRYENILDEIKFLDEYRKRLQQILETKGEGEVDISKAAYPETYIEIKNMQKRIDSIVSGSFYVIDKELHHN
ncbi:MAG: FapA family protein [Clostridiaceae bacterium]|nr:FapA family protein [Clostridiaceae bacterium]